MRDRPPAGNRLGAEHTDRAEDDDIGDDAVGDAGWLPRGVLARGDCFDRRELVSEDRACSARRSRASSLRRCRRVCSTKRRTMLTCAGSELKLAVTHRGGGRGETQHTRPVSPSKNAPQHSNVHHKEARLN